MKPAAFLALSLLFAPLLSAQPTVVQKVFSSVTGATTSSPVQNVGQFGHLVSLQFANAPAQTCVTASAQAQLEYSDDGTNYYAFGVPQTSLTTSSTVTQQLYSGVGVFSYVRFKLTAFDTTNCIASAWYSGGGFNPVSTVGGILPIGTALAAGASNTFAELPIFVGAIGVGATKAPLIQCDLQAQATVTAGNTLRIIPAGGVRIKVCAFTISMSAAGTAQWQQGTGSNCGTTTVNLSPAMGLLGSTPWALGSGLGTVLSPTSGTDLCVAAVTGNAAVWVSYILY